ncbi:MAG: hypothetical protein QME83_04870 [Thermodesulfobacteriota bacterium]|nr:hypothetical protein [Thermodesulfobacteriota bacterium]
MNKKGDQKMKKIVRVGMLLGLLGAIGVLMGMPAMGQPPENWTAGIAYEVVPAAKITKISFYMDMTEAGPMLFYDVGIQNVSEKPVRFKLTIYPLEGDPVAGLYPLMPRRGKPLALEPKEEMVLKWPIFAKEMPKGFALVVKDVEE